MTVESPVVEACIKAEETRYLVELQQGGIHQCIHPNCGAIFGEAGLKVAEGRIHCVDVIQRLEHAETRLEIMKKGPRPGSKKDPLIIAGSEYRYILKEGEVKSLMKEAISLGVYGKLP